MTHLVKLEDYADVMTLSDFMSAVRSGCITNWDGSGYYANSTHYDREAPAIPSDMKSGNIRIGCTHVAWFNK